MGISFFAGRVKGKTKAERIRYFLSKIIEHINDPIWFLDYTSLFFASLYFKLIVGNHGEYILKKDWDNLIILDACRWDYLRKVTGVDIPFIISRGSSTPEFLWENFGDDYHEDIIYVSSNPYVDIFLSGKVYKVVSVWRVAWDKKEKTVLPKDMVKYAKYYRRKYPHKRFIIHFVQPHTPFVGNNEIKRVLKCKGVDWDPWYAGMRGILSASELWRAYERNLRYVLPYAVNLAKSLKGLNVITADHGETFKRLWFPPVFVYGHHRSIYIDELVKVPWWVFDNRKG